MRNATAFRQITIIIVEEQGGSINNVNFENIEIFKDTGRPLTCLIYGENVENFVIDNVQYKNIKYYGELPAKITSNGKQNTINATLENVQTNGRALESRDIITDSFANVTIK